MMPLFYILMAFAAVVFLWIFYPGKLIRTRKGKVICRIYAWECDCHGINHVTLQARYRWFGIDCWRFTGDRFSSVELELTKLRKMYGENNVEVIP